MNKNFKFLIYISFINTKLNYAHKTQAPPTRFIFSSADFEKNFAFTITGCFGIRPLPNNL